MYLVGLIFICIYFLLKRFQYSGIENYCSLFLTFKLDVVPHAYTVFSTTWEAEAGE